MQDRWFIAAVPPGKIIEKVEIHRQYAARHFNVKKALNSPPHITLFPPFHCAQKPVDDLSIMLNEFVGLFQALEIEVRNFKAFKPRVIFLDVEPNPQLSSLYAALDHLLRWQFRLIEKPENRSFKPHLTIAHRDLDKKLFKPAWEHYKDISFCEKFTLKNIVLFRHDGKKWIEYRSYKLT